MYQKVFELHSRLLKAISHPKRLEIIHLLREKSLSVRQIEEMLGLEQANLSQHLQILRAQKVVKYQKKGKQVFYRLAHQNFTKASDSIREVLIERHKNDPFSNEFSMKMTDLVPVVKDPVCGMRLSPKTAAYAVKIGDKTFYLCAEGCFKKFESHPEKYLKLT